MFDCCSSHGGAWLAGNSCCSSPLLKLTFEPSLRQMCCSPRRSVWSGRPRAWRSAPLTRSGCPPPCPGKRSEPGRRIAKAACYSAVLPLARPQLSSSAAQQAGCLFSLAEGWAALRPSPLPHNNKPLPAPPLLLPQGHRAAVPAAVRLGPAVRPCLQAAAQRARARVCV